jgi:glycosyltransferase involved in cell wall biosynthesis
MQTYSLIVCTHNRSEQLNCCLKKLPLKQLSFFQVELIVVNNASTDDTELVIKEFKQTHYPSLQYLYEPKEGLGNARNAGLRIATGQYILFTDDDCYLPPNYFSKLEQVLSKQKFDYYGGSLIPYDQQDDEYGHCFIDAHLEIPPYSFLRPGLILGGHMIISRTVFQAIGFFDPGLGAGKQYRFEDIDYLSRASLAGLRGACIPEIFIFHHHRRKRAGSAVNKIKKQDAYSNGAYAMKLFLMGRSGVVKDMLRYWIGTLWTVSSFYEIKGFISYLFNLAGNAKMIKINIHDHDIK